MCLWSAGVAQRLLIKRCLSYVIVAVTVFIFSSYWHELRHSAGSAQYVSDDGNSYMYDRNMSLIFIGGMPRSGTTLIRAMLDAHPGVRCGEETHVIPLALRFQKRWQKLKRNRERLEEAGITDNVFSSAVAAFILEVYIPCLYELVNGIKYAQLARMYCSLLYRDERVLILSEYWTEVTATLIFTWFPVFAR